MTTHSNEIELSTFCGYNDWAKDVLGVELYTDFVYTVIDEGACENEDVGEIDVAIMKGRQVVIAEDIPPQALVFQIPFVSLCSLATMCEDAHDLHFLFSSFHASIELHEEVYLAALIIYEKFVRAQESKWSRHLQLLPLAYTNPLYFTKEEVEALDGTDLYYVAHEMQERVREDYAVFRSKILPELKQFLPASVCLEDTFSYSKFVWAISTIWSRFVSIEIDAILASQLNLSFVNDEMRLKAMIPVFDMLNHDPRSEMTYKFCSESQKFQLITHQYCMAGVELCINYGPLSNHQLVAMYGFALRNNPYNIIELNLSMEAGSTDFFEVKQAILASSQFKFDHNSSSVELTESDTPDKLIIVARVQELNADSCSSAKKSETLAMKILEGDVDTIVSKKHEQKVLLRLIYLLVAKRQMLIQHDKSEFDRRALRDRVCKIIDILRDTDSAIWEANIKKLVCRLQEAMSSVQESIK